MVTQIRGIAIALIVIGAGEMFQGLFGINPLLFVFGCPRVWGFFDCGSAFSDIPDAHEVTIGLLFVLVGTILLIIQFIKYKGHLPKEQDYI